ncbi:MAG: ABC transporter permease [Anaerolineales bacterium]|nr:ABC transporter permease [Anaerolineales bacterium]
MSFVKLKLEKTETPSVWSRPVLVLLSLLATFLLTAGLILLSGKNPFEVFYYFLIQPFTSRYTFLEVLVKTTPLLICGIAVTYSFVSGYYNIGAEGQLYAGAISAAWLGVALDGLPMWLTLILMLIGGFFSGMVWALIPALLKVKMAVDEVVTTLLMNSIMAYVVSMLLNGPWRDPESGWPQSPEIALNAHFPQLIAKSRLHLGFVVALLLVLVLWFVLNRTSFGLRMRAVGLGKPAAKFAGVNVDRTMMMAALISGGIAGIAGVSEIAGIQFHLIGEISPGYGYTGVIIATLGALSAFGVGIAAFFFGIIDVGAQTVSRVVGIPIYLGEVTQAAMLLVTISFLLLQRYRIRRTDK